MFDGLPPEAAPPAGRSGTPAGTGASRPQGFPVRVAAIDVGSNAIRFVAAEFSGPTANATLEQVRTPVRLGHDAFLTGRLAPAAMDAAARALASYRERIEALGIRHFRAVATSAVRDSDNGEGFRRRVTEECGIPLEVITGAEEVRLVHQAVRSTLPLGRASWILADLGGGSVEVSLVGADQVHWSVSHGMGSVRLLEELTVAGDEPGRFRRRLQEYASTLRLPVTEDDEIAGFIATGGNIEALARLAPDVQRRGGTAILPLERLRETIETLARLSYRQRVAELGLREDRADVILPAALVYERLCVLAGFDAIHVPFVGVKEGVLFDLVDDYAGHEPHRARQDQVIHNGAIALGKRYGFDIAHARHVTLLALSLFDQLEPLHGMGTGDRRLLMAAALLHDVGQFIDYKGHHKHSLYIISQSELPGLTPVEIRLVANIARYHRKSAPQPHHAEFMALDEADRVRVARLAAMLRLADGLDREHRQTVSAVRVLANESDAVLLKIEGAGDLVLERWAVERKANVFEYIFGRKVLLRVAGRNP